MNETPIAVEETVETPMSSKLKKLAKYAAISTAAVTAVLVAGYFLGKESNEDKDDAEETAETIVPFTIDTPTE